MSSPKQRRTELEEAVKAAASRFDALSKSAIAAWNELDRVRKKGEQTREDLEKAKKREGSCVAKMLETFSDPEKACNASNDSSNSEAEGCEGNLKTTFCNEWTAAREKANAAELATVNDMQDHYNEHKLQLKTLNALLAGKDQKLQDQFEEHNALLAGKDQKLQDQFEEHNALLADKDQKHDASLEEIKQELAGVQEHIIELEIEKGAAAAEEIEKAEEREESEDILRGQVATAKNGILMAASEARLNVAYIKEMVYHYNEAEECRDSYEFKGNSKEDDLQAALEEQCLARRQAIGGLDTYKDDTENLQLADEKLRRQINVLKEQESTLEGRIASIVSETDTAKSLLAKDLEELRTSHNLMEEDHHKTKLENIKIRETSVNVTEAKTVKELNDAINSLAKIANAPPPSVPVSQMTNPED